MTESDVRRLFLHRLGIRLGPEMGAYVLERFRTGGVAPVPIMGGDARTGVPVRRFIDLSQVLGSPADDNPARPAVR